MTDTTRLACSIFRTTGLDERDYELWSAISQLPSYGVLSHDDTMVSRKQVIELIQKAAEERFEREWREKYGRR